MRQMILGIVVTVFACGEIFILESNTQDDASHAPMIKPAAVAGLEMSAVVLTSKDGKVTVRVRANNPGEATGKKTLRIFLQESPLISMTRMPPQPKVVWTKDVEIDLAAGEEQSFEFRDSRFASLTKMEEAEIHLVLSELVVMCGKERATISSNPGNPSIDGALIGLPEAIRKELNNLSKGK